MAPPSAVTNAARKRRILIVDDEPGIRTTLGGILEMQGFEVETANDAHGATQKLVTQVFDLVITDLRMETEFAGYDVIRSARRQQYHPAIIVLSAAPFSGNGWAVEDTFIKGSNVVEFLQRVQAVLNEPATAPALN